MNNKIILAACIATLLAVAGCEKPKSETEIATEKIQKGIADKTPEPNAVQFRGVKYLGPTKGICGEINSKNTHGGYDGFRPFGALPDGQVVIIGALPIEMVKPLAAMESSKRVEYAKGYLLSVRLQGTARELDLALRDIVMLDQFPDWTGCFQEDKAAAGK